VRKEWIKEGAVVLDVGINPVSIDMSSDEGRQAARAGLKIR
jgi:5,10-methylene-tetrahydrofolate dehydrogenase/methenyl tetrahydrofolate cyclohydrolase